VFKVRLWFFITKKFCKIIFISNKKCAFIAKSNILGGGVIKHGFKAVLVYATYINFKGGF
jgi:hypothetical protein